ncbi:MAG: hypothetical protein U9Q79_06030, partial [Candidatus Hydrogenedentes bacterium]|nr:hypothetical protein [Candidatus Hydrogenedentota bacterium]
SRLLLNLNTSAAGEARISLLESAGNPVPGFGSEKARVINGDYLAATASWTDRATDVSGLSGKPVRLRFDCRGTKLYSFQFGE